MASENDTYYRRLNFETQMLNHPLTEDDIGGWKQRLDTLMHDADLGTTLRWKQELRALATIKQLNTKLEVIEKLYEEHAQCSQEEYCNLHEELGYALRSK